MTEQDIVNLLKQKFTENPRFNRKQFAADYSINYNLVIKLGVKYNLDLPKYKINSYFFESIDNEVKAYWLGFLYADGCMTKTGGINLLLSTDDRNHLQKYKIDLGIENPIEDTISKIKNSKTGYQHASKVRVTDKKLYSDLVKLGCTRLKTLTLRFPSPNQVPEVLIRHFIRGYFDGDGSVWEALISGGKYKSLQCGITSTYDIVMNIKKVLLAVGISKVETVPHPHSGASGIYILRIRRNNDVIKFYNYIYQNSTVYMDRKKNKFLEFGMKEIVPVNDLIKCIILTNYQEIPFTSKDVQRHIKVSFNCVQNNLKKLKSSSFIKKNGSRDKCSLYKYAKN